MPILAIFSYRNRAYIFFISQNFRIERAEATVMWYLYSSY